MERAAVIERVERITATRHDAAAGPAAIEAALESERELRAWLDASAADITVCRDGRR